MKALNSVGLSPDDLCDGVSLGEAYTVIGVPVYELSESATHASIAVTMEVCELERERERA